MNENDFAKIESMVSRHIGVFADSIQHKLDLVVEGHQLLSEKIDRVEQRLDDRIDCVVRKLDVVTATLDATAAKVDIVAAQVDALAVRDQVAAAKLNFVTAKIDAVAADLKAHRQDTEAHHPVYRVQKEARVRFGIYTSTSISMTLVIFLSRQWRIPTVQKRYNYRIAFRNSPRH